jgi:hypothetical protein
MQPQTEVRNWFHMTTLNASLDTVIKHNVKWSLRAILAHTLTLISHNNKLNIL